MVVHAEARPGTAVLSRGQRRRIGARDLQGSRDHAERPASPDRGLPHRVVRDACQRLLHLYPRRIRAGSRPARCRDRRGLRGASRRPRQHPRLSVRHLPASRRRRLHLRRGNGAAGVARRQEGHAAAEAAIPCQYGALRFPDDGEQRRVDRGRADDPAPWRRLVRELRRQEQHRARNCSACRAT